MFEVWYFSLVLISGGFRFQDLVIGNREFTDKTVLFLTFSLLKFLKIG